MKRDPRLMKLILLQVRDEHSPVELEQYPEPDVIYNSALLVKSNCVDGTVLEDGTGNYASVVMLHLTDKGHDLLEELESEAPALPQMTTPTRPNGQYPVTIFISHSAKDEKLAEALVELLRAALSIPADKIRCTSVNGYRLPAGASTNEQLRREVHESQVLIGLITPSSMVSAFVLFEWGARWGAGLCLVPLLGAGADASYMRGPLGTLNALNCQDAAQVHQLINDLARLLSVANTTLPAAYQAHVDSLVEASKALHTKAGSYGSAGQSPVLGVAEQPLTADELTVMKLFVNTPKAGLLEERLAEKLGLHRLKVDQLLDHLVKRELLYRAARMGLPAYHRLTSKGRDYLIDEHVL